MSGEGIKLQTIIITGDKDSFAFQILMPPFRPIHMFEVEDHFDDLVKEINENVLDSDIAVSMVRFLKAFKESIDQEEMAPLLAYFITYSKDEVDISVVQSLFSAVREYIHFNKDPNRLMN